MHLLIFSLMLTTMAGGSQTESDVRQLLQKALKNDPAVFASEYMHDAFVAWQTRFQMQRVTVDSSTRRGEYTEAHVRFSKSGSRDWYAAVVLFRHGTTAKIVDVRKKLAAPLYVNEPEARQIIAFIERLAWLYDTGQHSLVMDILYPDYVELQYTGLADKKAIVEKLHEQFKEQLPISGFSWERKEPQYLLSLVLDSPLKPLTVAIDLQKHDTARFFDFADKKERTAALLDSLRRWQQVEKKRASRDDLVVAAPNPEQAVQQVLADYFRPYTLQIEKKNEEVWRVQAGVEGLTGFSSITMRFDLMFEPDIQGQLIVQPSWLAPENIVEHFQNEQNLTFANGSSYAVLLGQTVRRYVALALPAAFRPLPAQQLTGKIYVHNTHIDSIVWRDAEEFERMLVALARDKIVSFYPGKTEIRDKNVWVSGHVVFQDSRHLWHHIAKIREQYILIDKAFVLDHIEIDLHPFIRMENVKDVFADDEPLPREGAGIPVKRE